MKNIKKHWNNKGFWLVIKTSIFWLVVFYFISSLGYIVIINPRNVGQLKDDFQVSQQDLHSCRSELKLYQDQIESGSVKIVRDEECKQTIERWETKGDYQEGDIVGR